MKKTIMLVYLLGLCMICLFAQKRANNLQVGTGYAFFWDKGMSQSIRRNVLAYRLNVYKRIFFKGEFSEIGYIQSHSFGQNMPLPKDTALWKGFIFSRLYKTLNITVGYSIIPNNKRHLLVFLGGYSYRWGDEALLRDYIYWGNDVDGNPVYEQFGERIAVKQHGINLSIDYSFFLTRNKLLSIDNCLSTQVFWKGDPSLCINTGLGVNF